MNIAFLLLFTLMIVSSNSYSCTFVKHGGSNEDEINYYISSSKEIYLAEAKSFKKGSILFVVVENIKGPFRKEFSFKGTISEGSGKDDSFNNHDLSSEFWNSQYIGRIPDHGTCEFSPTFVVGHEYLIFKSNPHYFKAAERIKSQKDLWYLRVKKMANLPSK